MSIFSKFRKSRAMTVATFGVLSLMALNSSFVRAQTTPVPGIQVTPTRAYTVSDAVTAVDVNEAIRIRYVGIKPGAATVAVATNNSIAFVEDGAADTLINIATGPTQCGVTVGTLDLTSANCNTMGKLVDHINASKSWEAALAGSLRSDTSNGNINNVAATDAKTPDGLGLTFKTSAILSVTAVLLPGGGRLTPSIPAGAFGSTSPFPAGIQNWFGDKLANPPTINKLYRAPFNDTTTILQYASENVTSTGTVGNMIAYCVFEQYKSGGYGSTEVAINMFQKAGAATTVTGNLDEFKNTTGLVCAGGKVLYRISATTTLTAPIVVATGIRFPRASPTF